MNFTTERLKLSEITKDDIPNIHHLHTFPEVDEFNTLGIPENIEKTIKVHQIYLDDQEEIIRSKYLWCIYRKDDNQFIGIMGLLCSNDKFRMAELYYKLLPQYWGMGYATESARAVIHFGFTQLNLHRIEAGVATKNAKSIRVLEKTGMTREGIRRKILPIRGIWTDSYHYAIVEDDPGWTVEN